MFMLMLMLVLLLMLKVKMMGKMNGFYGFHKLVFSHTVDINEVVSESACSMFTQRMHMTAFFAGTFTTHLT